jgi:uncharacterized membrane protein
MLGPIDYIAVSFKGNNFDGSILEALASAVKNGIIRVVDFVFIIKDEDGNVLTAEIEDQEDDLKELADTLSIEGDMPLLTDDDTRKLGEKMDNDTSAGLLVIEQVWAKDLKQALIDADATLIDEGRIHPEVVTAAVEELDEQKTANVA